jgi:hypothetical protein
MWPPKFDMVTVGIIVGGVLVIGAIALLFLRPSPRARGRSRERQSSSGKKQRRGNGKSKTVAVEGNDYGAFSIPMPPPPGPKTTEPHPMTDSLQDRRPPKGGQQSNRSPSRPQQSPELVLENNDAPTVAPVVTLDDLSSRLTIVESHVGLTGLESSTWWERLGRCRRQAPRIQIPQGMEQAEAKLLAIVNQWWTLPARERRDLEGMAQAIDLRVFFCDTPELSREMGDVTRRETTFIRAELGGWLCVEAEPGLLMAVPADVMYFRSDVAFAHIARLFERSGNYEEPLGFERVYRACRLRSAGGAGDAYRIPGNDSERGFLVLRGGEFPALHGPPKFDDWFDAREAPNEPIPLLRPLQARIDGVVAEVQVMLRRSADDERGTSRPVLDEHGNKLSEIRESIDALVRQLNGLKAEVEGARGAQAAAEALKVEVAALRQELVVLKQVAAKPAPPVASNPVSARLPLVSGAEPAAPVAKPVQPVQPVRAAAPPAPPPPPPPPPPVVQKPVTAPPELSRPRPLAPVSEQAPTAVPANDRRGVEDPDQIVSGVLQATLARVSAAGVEPDYVTRLAASADDLQVALGSVAGGWRAEIVHLSMVPREQVAELQLHRGVGPVAGHPGGGLRCSVCEGEIFEGSYVAQFAILAESGDGSDARLYVPLGLFMGSAYRKGYQHLVAQADGGTVTGVAQGARLRRQPRGDYVVLSKMQLVLGVSEQ